MRRNGLKNGLLMTTSFMTMVLGYSRRAYATCSPLPGPSNAYICSGIPGVPTSYSFYGTDVSVLAAAPTFFYNNGAFPSSDQILIEGDGDLTFEAQDSVYLYSYDQFGVRVNHLDSSYEAGNIQITTAYEPPTAFIEWGIEGYEGGIGAFHDGTGNIYMDLSSRVTGYYSGVTAIHYGTGNIDINVGSATPGEADGTISATGTGAGYHGINALHGGSGAITITLNGDVESAGGNGVNAANSIGGTGISVYLGDGDVYGKNNGIYTYQNGVTGGIFITPTSPTAPGEVTGHYGDGIFALNSGSAGISIETGAGDITGGAAAGFQAYADGIEALDYGTGGIDITVNDSDVTGDQTGVRAKNSGGGSVSVTTNGGNIAGTGTGITAYNTGGTGSVTVTTGDGTVSGYYGDGIYAKNLGAGGIVVETGTGAISGGGAVGYQVASFGIEAVDSGAGGIQITVNDSDVSGDPAAILATNSGGGSMDITTYAGNISGVGAGIQAYNFGGAGSVSVTSGSGTVTGDESDGILAQNTGNGGVTIETGSGAITGGAAVGNDFGAYGIEAVDGGTGGISITVNDSDVTGDTGGIRAGNWVGGDVTITTYAGNILGKYGVGIQVFNDGTSGAIDITTGTGYVKGATRDGIYAVNNTSGGITIETGSGAITGGADAGFQSYAVGIEAIDSGAGGIDITVNDSDVTGDEAGVRARNSGGGSITITTYAGNIAATGAGIIGYNTGGTGSVTVTTGAGTVTSESGDGIYAKNTGDGGIVVETGSGAITGGANAGYQALAFGIEAIDSGAGGIEITVNDSDVSGDAAGILATNSGGGSVDITTYAGNVSGLNSGILAYNFGGSGAVTITTGDGTVTGDSADGLFARNTGSGGIVIETGAGAITGGNQAGLDGSADGIHAVDSGTGGIDITVNDSDVTGDALALRAYNTSGGSINITTYAGNLLGKYGGGIFANNAAGSGGVEIVTGEGSITGNVFEGILVVNHGSAGIVIETGSGNITGAANAGNQGGYGGIEAADFGTGGIEITVNDSDVTGDSEGVWASNTGGGNVKITTYAGDILGQYGKGINAYNSNAGGYIDIATGAGTVTGVQRDGVYARNLGSTGLTITTGTGDITGGSAAGDQSGSEGIEARDTGAGNLAITVNDSNVTGDSAGVAAFNSGGGSLILKTYAGNILGKYGYGIQADTTGGTGGVEITTGAGTVTGNLFHGIKATNSGDAGVVITTGTGDITGGGAAGTQTGADGIYVSDTGTGGVEITVNDSNVTGDGDGVAVFNRGGGDIDITTNNGNIAGATFTGIFAYNNAAGGAIRIATNTGTVEGGTYGILARNNGTGLLSITTGDGDITGNGAGQDGIRAEGNTGSGGVEITLAGAADVTGGDDGISAYSNGGALVIDVSAATGVITGESDSGIEAVTGVFQTGGLTITTGAGYGGVAVDGQDFGIKANHLGAGLLSITTGSGSVTGTDIDGIFAYNKFGTGVDITTGSGDVSGDGDDGIEVWNFSGYVTINTYSGDITGGDDGIAVGSYGNGGVQITTRDSLIEGVGANGIDVIDTGTGGVTISTGAGDADGQAVYGYSAGIRVTNYLDGSIDITIGDGDIEGYGGSGISAYNGSGTDDVTVTLTGAANVTGGAHGIQAVNEGLGGVIVDADAATGLIEGKAGDGIVAQTGSNATTGITITTGVGNGTDAVIGNVDGIDATNYGEASISITTGAGAVTGKTGDGIHAYNGYYAEDITIKTYAGAVLGNQDGIDAINHGYGSITVTTGTGTVTGTTGDGIHAYNDTNGVDITITTGTGKVEGSEDGIQAGNLGTGSLTITTYGQSIGGTGDGVHADNGGYSTYEYGLAGKDLTITTHAYVKGGADGIEANNDGTGSVTITTNAAVRGDGGDGIKATNGIYASGNYGTDLRITTNDEVSGSVNGISAVNTGNGLTRIETKDIVTGDDGDGIYVRNGIEKGYTNYGSDLIIVADKGVYGNDGDGIDAQNNGTGVLRITTSDIVEGKNGAGITATNFGNDGTYVEAVDVQGTTDGIRALNYGYGVVEITVSGTVDGGTGQGIDVYQASSADATVTVEADAEVGANFAAIQIISNAGGALIIDNAGTLRNSSGLDSDLVIFTADGETDLDNTGLMTGRIEFGVLDDVFTNSGTWNVGGTSGFGTGTDSLTNSNLIIAANQAGVSETTTFTGLESFSNSGTIDLADDTPGGGSTAFDTLSISGNFTGVAGALQLDAYLGGVGSDADTLVIGGTASGTTGIEIFNTGGTGGTGANILLVDTAGSTGSEFFLTGGPISLGIYIYDLFWDGQDFYLQSELDVTKLDAATFPAILADLWEVTAATWHRNTEQMQADANSGGTSGLSASSKDQAGQDVIGWGALVGDHSDGEGTIIVDVNGTPTSVDVAFDQRSRAFIGGVDTNLARDANGGVMTLGAMIGVVDSSVRFDLTGNSVDFDGITYGLHLAYATDQFRADMLLKRDDLELEYTVAELAAEPGRADAATTGVSLEFGMKLHETSSMTVEAVGNLSHVSTRIDSFQIDGSTFSFDNSDTTRGAIGLTFRGNVEAGGTTVTPTATLKYWDVFDGGYTSAIDAVAFNYANESSYLEVSGMLEFANPTTGWSSFVSGTGFIGDERRGARAQIGLNLEW